LLSLIHPLPLSFEKEKAIQIIFFLLFPLSNSVREGELKGVSKKERGDTKVVLFNCSSSLTLLERGNKKGVSKKRGWRCENCFIQLPSFLIHLEREN